MISDFFFFPLRRSRVTATSSPPPWQPYIVDAHLSQVWFRGLPAFYQREGAAISVTAPSSLGRYVCTHGTPVSPRTRSLTQKVGTCLVVAFRFNQPRSHANLLRSLSSVHHPPPPSVHDRPKNNYAHVCVCVFDQTAFRNFFSPFCNIFFYSN